MTDKHVPFDIDEDAIRKLADLMQETGLTEIEVAEGERAIRVSMASTTQSVSVGSPSHRVEPMSTNESSAATGAPPMAHPGTVNSPMVGTVYLQADPSSPAFIKAGDRVKAGDTLLIIEAMKVMNTIKAPRAGTVTRIIVSDAQPVEFGEALLIIE